MASTTVRHRRAQVRAATPFRGRAAPEWRWFDPVHAITGADGSRVPFDHPEHVTLADGAGYELRNGGLARGYSSDGGRLDLPNTAGLTAQGTHTFVVAVKLNGSVGNPILRFATGGGSGRRVLETVTGPQFASLYDASQANNFGPAALTLDRTHVVVLQHDDSDDTFRRWVDGVLYDDVTDNMQAKSGNFQLLNNAAASAAFTYAYGVMEAFYAFDRFLPAGQVRQISADPHGPFRPWRPVSVGGATTHQLSGAIALALTPGATIDVTRSLGATVVAALDLSATLTVTPADATGEVQLSDAPAHSAELTTAGTATVALADSTLAIGSVALLDAGTASVTTADATAGTVEVSDG